MMLTFTWQAEPGWIRLFFGGRLWVSPGDSLLGWLQDAEAGAVAIIDKGEAL